MDQTPYAFTHDMKPVLIPLHIELRTSLGWGAEYFIMPWRYLALPAQVAKQECVLDYYVIRLNFGTIFWCSWDIALALVKSALQN